ncbi:MAG: hypothetical protein IJI16_05475 [Atopobiaceae bacterium]|nr:hypothetical protein [Atopobiaceae bacterium]MBQ6411378.1 hypothetical protein [Atopobiaceae bacterium]MBQ6650403.1 hypothetical protein [Atopobiaceae bacterium]
MAAGSEGKRKKVRGDAEHRTGTIRAAVKPGVTVGRKSVSRVISDFITAKGARAFTHSYWGSTLTASADALRKEFELPAGEELYFFTKLPGTKQTAGVLLSSSGFHLLDGKGGFANASWETFAACVISYSRGVVAVGQLGIAAPDSAVLAELLQTIKTSLS